MLLYELNHRNRLLASASESLRTTVAELGHTKSSASSRHLLRRWVAHALVGLVILSTLGVASAQDQSRSWRLTYQDRTAKTNPVAVHFETRPQAEAWQQNLMQDNASSKGLGLTPNYSDFRIEQVVQKSERADQETAISYAGEAIRALRDRMQKGSGRLGDTLRDYANVVKGSLKNANQLRSTLLSMTGNIERQTFDKINQSIEDYNKQAEAYNELVTSPDTILRLQQENGGKIVGPQDYPKMATVATVRPDQLKATLNNAAGTVANAGRNSASPLVGKTARGTSNGGKHTFKFKADGQVIWSGEGEDEDKRASVGKWSHEGNRVVVQFTVSAFENNPARTLRFEGTLNGDTITGVNGLDYGNGILTGSFPWRASFKEKSSLDGAKIKAKDGYLFYVLNEDGTVSWTYNKWALGGKWKKDGNRLTISLDSYGRPGYSNYGGATVIIFQIVGEAELQEESSTTDGVNYGYKSKPPRVNVEK